ncbi:nucleotidyltransferase family protein [Martelella lutilitoris]|uniref:Nucleotidyltransferase family protein n=1 Tax=Martelella lutilitoris TaxID=2583532 RepID=A0A5C4JVY0_9HYPH|nr:nucleotidyltransferase family protein [Martelella lutilitoris]TNB49505.1 nucleotidyltransferase family protein [Martelella lutilitoris]
MDDQCARLAAALSESPLLSPILENFDRIDLPDCWLVAGVLAQTMWNRRFGYAPGHGIADIDIVYFDPNDLSERGEAREAARVRAMFEGVPAWIDVKNQARVHLWYCERFGYGIEPYDSVSEAITTFPATATSVGMRPVGARWQCDAPFGLADLMNATVRPNKTQASREVYENKAERWLALWPELTVIEWDE